MTVQQDGLQCWYQLKQLLHQGFNTATRVHSMDGSRQTNQAPTMIRRTALLQLCIKGICRPISSKHSSYLLQKLAHRFGNHPSLVLQYTTHMLPLLHKTLQGVLLCTQVPMVVQGNTSKPYQMQG